MPIDKGSSTEVCSDGIEGKECGGHVGSSRTAVVDTRFRRSIMLGRLGAV